MHLVPGMHQARYPPDNSYNQELRPLSMAKGREGLLLLKRSASHKDAKAQKLQAKTILFRLLQSLFLGVSSFCALGASAVRKRKSTAETQGPQRIPGEGEPKA